MKKLENGDCISFLPNDLTFRVERKGIEDTTAEEALEHEAALEHKAAEVFDTKDGHVECSSEVLEDNNGKDKVSNVEDTSVEINKESEGLVPSGEVLTRNTELDDEEEDYVDDEGEEGDDKVDRTEIEETAQPLNKTRVLPSWMTKNKG